MPAPVKHTCPDIDKAIKQIKSALKAAIDGKRGSVKGEDAWDCFDTIEDELWGLESQLEDLRKDNDYLRSWGHDLEKEVSNLEEELAKMEK